jgi:osmotically inducible protein OsmC
MAIRSGKAIWEGDLKNGKGVLTVGSDVFTGKYSFASRFEEGDGTNPEELIAAAHAACFSMALSADLSKAGYQVNEIQTKAEVKLEKGSISGIKLITKAKVKDINMDEFAEIASGSKKNCPVSKALAAVDIQLEAHLIKS